MIVCVPTRSAGTPRSTPAWGKFTSSARAVPPSGAIRAVGGTTSAPFALLVGEPALDVATTLRLRGASVVVHDPRAGRNVRRYHPELAVADSVAEACADADLVLVLTDWDEYRGLDPVSLASVVRRPVAVDGRLVLDPDKWRAAGWDVHALGRRSA